MTQRSGLRERKKHATRLHISTVATRLFIERGFDEVTVAEVAEAANVSKMTVFNYFPRKEDLYFDREGEAAELLACAVRERPAGRSPVGALRDLARKLTAEAHPFSGVRPGVPHFWRVVQESAALRARAREMLEALEEGLTRVLLAAVAGGDVATARMVACMVLAVFRGLHREAIRRLTAGEPVDVVQQHQLELVEQAFNLVEKGVAATPFGGAGDGKPSKGR
jgi:AcrR family transcriptional regulator